VASEAVGKHKVSGGNGWIHSVGWQIDGWMDVDRCIPKSRTLVEYYNLFHLECTAGLLAIVRIQFELWMTTFELINIDYAQIL
jgi:hypothetical protein